MSLPKYSFFILLLIGILSFAGCVSGKRQVPSDRQTEENRRQTKNKRRQSSKGKTYAIEIPNLKNNSSEQIIEHKGYTVSFNKETRLPNWVAYELTSIEVSGTFPRDRNYYVDPDVIGPQADNGDYHLSGWDRGHMAPAGDMKWSDLAMTESCYFSNICPQNQNLNGGDWRSLEERSRNLAQDVGSLYIACGPIVGQAKNGTLGPNQVVIPDAFYKVILYCHEGNYEGIGFSFTNTAGHRPLDEYALSIDQVESLTGIDFFISLRNSIENKIEATYDINKWDILFNPHQTTKENNP